MRDGQVRLGLLYAGGGAEQDYYQFAESVQDRVRMFLVGTRVGGGGSDDHSVASLLRTAEIDNLTEATRRRGLLRPDAVMWACTSGSFIVGRRGAERPADAMAAVAKVPASSTSLAFARALSILGLRRVAVLAPYPEAAARAFVAFLGEWGIEIDGFLWLEALNGFDSALIPAEAVVRAARETDRRTAEALLIPDTALSTLPIVDELERALGKTVLTANQVTIWEGLRLAGSSLTVSGHRQLLAMAPSEMRR